MIRRIEALRYRRLRHVEVELDDFQVLVGPNAGGKSTLLDAVVFLGELVNLGPREAVKRRTSNFRDLVWNRPDDDLAFEIAVEVQLPDEVRSGLPDGSDYDRVRYEVAVREDPAAGVGIDREQWFPLISTAPEDRHVERFPNPRTPPATIFTPFGQAPGNSGPSDLPLGGDRSTLPSRPGAAGHDSNWRDRSALGHLLISPDRVANALWLERDLWNVAFVALNNGVLRHASPRQGSFEHLNSDGSNLPWMVQRLKTEDPESYREWIEHVRTVIPELVSVDAVERPDDRHAYLVVNYGGGLPAPSWTVSDGTLRFLTLTLLAYLPNQPGRCVVEEPENGIHPLAMDAVYDSLRSMYDSQVFVVTHSPTLVQRAEADEILCFAKDEDGATDIVRGDRHPRLRNWLDSADTALLLSTGVFG